MVKVGGMMVAFGTGRNVTDDDTKSVQVQTLYSVLDNTRYREVTTPKGIRLEVHPGGGSCPNGSDCVPSPAALGVGVTNAKLAQQQITSVNVAGTIYGKVDTVTDLNSTTWNTYNGWYLDLPEVGERLLIGPRFHRNHHMVRDASRPTRHQSERQEWLPLLTCGKSPSCRRSWPQIAS